ncbi:hypothetical protein GGF32_004586 [Allomyces javanicus]|nr:hypothetical protein GGF32_004586 [Allomyces javanicus]
MPAPTRAGISAGTAAAALATTLVTLAALAVAIRAASAPRRTVAASADEVDTLFDSLANKEKDEEDKDEMLDRDVDDGSDSDWDFESTKVKEADTYRRPWSDHDDDEEEGDAGGAGEAVKGVTAGKELEGAGDAGGDDTDPDPPCYAEIEEVWDRSAYRYVRVKRKSKPDSAAKSTKSKAFYVHRRHVVTHGESDLKVNIRIEFQDMARVLQTIIPTEDKLYDSTPFVSARDLYAKIGKIETWVAEHAEEAKSAAGKVEAAKRKEEGKEKSVEGDGKSAGTAKNDFTDPPATVDATPSTKGNVTDPPASVDAATSSSTTTTAIAAKPSTDPADVVATHRAIRHLAMFLRTEFAELQSKFDRLIAQGLITYDLLWMLIQAGGIAFGHDAVYDRIQALRVARVRYVIPAAKDETPYLHITGTTIEWSGTRFFPLTVQRAIVKFSGARPLAELALRPIAQMPETTRAQLVKRGKMLEMHAGLKYVEYDGPLIVRQGHGGQQRIIKVPVASRIMVDRVSFERQNPDYDVKRPNTMALNDMGVDVTAGADGLALVTPFTNDEYLIMCPQIYGYAFGKKAWGEMLVELVKPIEFAANAYNQLVLESATKDLVLGLVESHGKLHADVIQGKGRGLIFLLHGRPGQGKTLTAEVIAEHLQRPLISMGAGELGTTADQLEGRLQDLLTLAETWDAVLLLDEADVFMERRSTHEMHRNACVSVFLRLLERYQGILFLTTNRVGTFDEAFHSRVSLALRFADMDARARQTVWAQALDRLAAHDTHAVGWRDRIDVAKLAQIPFNGRRINGIVRTAHALALRDKVPVDDAHIDVVIQRLRTFDEDVRHGKDPVEAGVYRAKGDDAGADYADAARAAMYM